MEDDPTLAARASAGDGGAFELLVRRHTDAVWRTAYAILRDRNGAEDAVQETFLKAFRSIGSFRAESSFRTWLLAIARSTSVDVLRRPSAEVTSLDDVRTERRRGADVTTTAALALAVEALPHDEREAFLLVDALGLSREEAARIVGVPASTLRSRLARAHDRLVSELGEPADGARRARKR